MQTHIAACWVCQVWCEPKLMKKAGAPVSYQDGELHAESSTLFLVVRPDQYYIGRHLLMDKNMPGQRQGPRPDVSPPTEGGLQYFHLCALWRIALNQFTMPRKRGEDGNNGSWESETATGRRRITLALFSTSSGHHSKPAHKSKLSTVHPTPPKSTATPGPSRSDRRPSPQRA